MFTVCTEAERDHYVLTICMEAERAYPGSTIYMDAGKAHSVSTMCTEAGDSFWEKERVRGRNGNGVQGGDRERQGEEGIVKAIRIEAVR